MTGSYAAFLASKRQMPGGDGFAPTDLPAHLFDFQRHLVDWALRRGRAAVLADCGLGKTPIELAWADQVHRRTGRPVLLATPLAVSFQTIQEAEKFGVEAATSRDGAVTAPVTVTNYERLEHFDPDQFGGVVCDESSAIKAFDGQRRRIVTELLRRHRFRLLCTATAAPNDYIELGTSSEALGELGYMDMLGRFFTNSQHTSTAKVGWRRQHAALDRQAYRFKGHAEQAFWQWVSSWARAVRRPSDLGFDDAKFELPALDQRVHIVDVSLPYDGALLEVPAVGLYEQRKEARHSLNERCETAAELLVDADPGVAWCHLNDEGKLLARLIDGAVEISGTDSLDAKEEKLAAFSAGEIRVLVTKPSIGAWGLNWQHCHRMTMFPSHSYEQYYQAIRRSWRFGQTEPVRVDVVTTEGGRNVLAGMQRKADQADAMFESLARHMRDALTVTRDDRYPETVEVPSWAS